MFYAAAAAAFALPLGGIGDFHAKPEVAPVFGNVSAAAAKQKTYGGHTTEGAPIAIRTLGRRVTDVIVFETVDCAQDSESVSGWLVRNPGKTGLARLQGGKLSRKGKFTATASVTSDGDTQATTTTVNVTGKLGGRRSSGALKIASVVTDKASGQQVDACHGSKSWSEKVPERRVYGGLTDQLQPVVLELSRNRKSVKKFWFGFQADCTPDGSIATTDVVTNFKIDKRKRFGDAFADEGSDGEGGTLHVDYALSGKVGRRSSSGKFSVTATDRDAGGTVISNCPTGDVGWTATQ